jgi:hypothetical protein
LIDIFVVPAISFRLLAIFGESIFAIFQQCYNELRTNLPLTMDAPIPCEVERVGFATVVWPTSIHRGDQAMKPDEHRAIGIAEGHTLRRSMAQNID